MKKIVWTTLGLVLLSSSCDSDCNDCDPYTEVSYSIVNDLDQGFVLNFYRNEGKLSEVTLARNSKKILYRISRAFQGGVLPVAPFDFDSLKIYSGNDSVLGFSSKSNCDNPVNALCEENFKKVGEERDAVNNLLISYEITIK